MGLKSIWRLQEIEGKMGLKITGKLKEAERERTKRNKIEKQKRDDRTSSQTIHY